MDPYPVNRREFLARTGLLTLGFGCRALAQQGKDEVIEIMLARNEALGIWYIDPLGILIQPGQTVRWRNVHWGATVTAYHPDNGNRELRIPKRAKPFDSGVLGDLGHLRQNSTPTFEWRFDQEGTYDYCSREQEIFGMVGRIVVGRPGGPGEKPLGYGNTQGRAPMFKRVMEVLAYAPSEKIVTEKKIPFPVAVFGRRY